MILREMYYSGIHQFVDTCFRSSNASPWAQLPGDVLFVVESIQVHREQFIVVDDHVLDQVVHLILVMHLVLVVGRRHQLGIMFSSEYSDRLQGKSHVSWHGKSIQMWNLLVGGTQVVEWCPGGASRTGRSRAHNCARTAGSSSRVALMYFFSEPPNTLACSVRIRHPMRFCLAGFT